MKFIENINVNSESKIYLSGILFSVIALFIITGIVFLVLIAGKLDIVMTQPADETYTYFIMIMDRIIFLLSILVIIPLTIYQITAKNKSQIDTTVSISAITIILLLLVAFFGGEYYYLKKYKTGDLSYSKMFCSQTIETKIFDSIITGNGETPPLMCKENRPSSK